MTRRFRVYLSVEVDIGPDPKNHRGVKASEVIADWVVDGARRYIDEVLPRNAVKIMIEDAIEVRE